MSIQRSTVVLVHGGWHGSWRRGGDAAQVVAAVVRVEVDVPGPRGDDSRCLLDKLARSFGYPLLPMQALIDAPRAVILVAAGSLRFEGERRSPPTRPSPGGFDGVCQELSCTRGEAPRC
jgi:hypothetical protein